jgi:hypothetical protein
MRHDGRPAIIALRIQMANFTRYVFECLSGHQHESQIDAATCNARRTA